jgi:hypothetical protein
MPRCIAYDVVDGKVGRCGNIIANEGIKVCSNLKCQRSYSIWLRSRLAAIAAFNIMDDDDDNVSGSGSEADELVAMMEVPGCQSRT